MAQIFTPSLVHPPADERAVQGRSLLAAPGQTQSIAPSPISRKYPFARENGLLPKNPLCAENGDGWGDVMTRCLVVSISAFLAIA